jgi:flagellar hook-associated protein 2
MITAPGVGSGLDIQSIISQLMALERRPLTVVDSKKREFEADLSAYGTLKSALSTFQEAMRKLSGDDDFRIHSATSSDEAVLTATAGATAAPGITSIEVLRIAERHKLLSANAFAATDTLAAGTTMTLTVGTTGFTVDLAGKTLAEARDAINSATDNAGVTAQVLNVDGGSKLLLTGDESGSDNFISVSYGVADPFALAALNTDRDASGSFAAADLDAVLKLEGAAALTATRSSNSVTDLIDGVTLELKAAGTVNLTIARDNSAVAENVQGFVDAFNTMRDKITELRGGALAGDGSLLALESRLMGVLNSAAGGNYKYLSEVGVSIQKDGHMALDTALLDDAIASDFAGFSALFSNATGGFAVRFEALADSLLDPDGLVDSREDGLNDRIDDLNDRRAALERRLESTEERLRAQFTALDGLLSNLRSTGDYLLQQLSSL